MSDEIFDSVDYIFNNEINKEKKMSEKIYCQNCNDIIVNTSFVKRNKKNNKLILCSKCRKARLIGYKAGYSTMKLKHEKIMRDLKDD